MALKYFIKGVGFVVLMLGGFWSLECSGIFLEKLFLGRLTYAELVVDLFLIPILVMVAFAGWRMFRNWNESTVTEYAFLQAVITSCFLGYVLRPYVHDGNTLIAVLFFLVMARGLKSFLIKFLSIPRKHSRQAALQA